MYNIYHDFEVYMIKYPRPELPGLYFIIDRKIMLYLIYIMVIFLTTPFLQFRACAV